MNYQISRGEVLTLMEAPAITAVWVKSGRVWLTRCDDPRDYCLKAGDRLPCRNAKMLVIEALADASLAIMVLSKEAPASARITLALSCQSNS